MSAERAPRRRSTTVRRADLNKALATVETQLPRLRDTGGKRPVLVVLGMHRSGTSLLSHVLHYLGADMADESDHISQHNSGGFWERPDIVALHDELLEVIGRPVNSPLHSVPFPAGWWRDKKVQPVKARMLKLVEKHLAETSGWWGFKDPRTCRLLPLWSELFEALDVRPHYVWTIRAPGESSASMAAKNPVARPMSTQQAEVTWLAYNYDILRYLLGTQLIVVEYGEWFRDPLALGRRLMQQLDLYGFTAEHEFNDCIRGIVNREFRHQVEGRGDAISSIPLAQSFFNEVAELSRSEDAEINQRLGRYITILDIVFRAMQPFAQLLGEVPTLRIGAQEGKQAAAQLEARKAHSAALQRELATVIEQRDQDAAEYAERLLAHERQLAELQSEHTLAAAGQNETRERLEAALATARGRASRLELYAESLVAEHAAGRETMEQRITKLVAEHTASREALEQRIAKLVVEHTASREALEQRIAKLVVEHTASREALEQRITKLVAEHATSREPLQLRITALEAELAAARSLAAQLDDDKSALSVELKNSEARYRELQVACDGYLARIEALKGRSKLWRWSA